MPPCRDASPRPSTSPATMAPRRKGRPFRYPHAESHGDGRSDRTLANFNRVLAEFTLHQRSLCAHRRTNRHRSRRLMPRCCNRFRAEEACRCQRSPRDTKDTSSTYSRPTSRGVNGKCMSGPPADDRRSSCRPRHRRVKPSKRRRPRSIICSTPTVSLRLKTAWSQQGTPCRGRTAGPPISLAALCLPAAREAGPTRR
jgi:hypothetical protein